MNRKEAGRKGGRSTARKHGRAYMREIGRRGAAVTWSRYHWQPIDLNNFALVDRQSGAVKAFMLPAAR